MILIFIILLAFIKLFVPLISNFEGFGSSEVWLWTIIIVAAKWFKATLNISRECAMLAVKVPIEIISFVIFFPEASKQKIRTCSFFVWWIYLHSCQTSKAVKPEFCSCIVLRYN